MKLVKYIVVICLPILAGTLSMALLSSWGPEDKPRVFWNWPAQYALSALGLCLLWALLSAALVRTELNRNSWLSIPALTAAGVALGLCCGSLVADSAKDHAEQRVRESILADRIGYEVDEVNKGGRRDLLNITISDGCTLRFVLHDRHNPPQLERHTNERLNVVNVGDPLESLC